MDSTIFEATTQFHRENFETILNGSHMIEYSPTAVFEKNKRMPMTDAGTAVYNVVIILSLGNTA